MKKDYVMPQVEVVRVNVCQPLANSVTSVDSGGIFEGSISGGNGEGRSRGCDDDWDE